MTESTGEAVAHDNQSLDSGAEGPDESDRPEHHPSPPGMSEAPATHFRSRWAPWAFHKAETTKHQREPVVVCTSSELMWIDCCLLVSRQWWMPSHIIAFPPGSTKVFTHGKLLPVKVNKNHVFWFVCKDINTSFHSFEHYGAVCYYIGVSKSTKSNLLKLMQEIQNTF